MSILKKKKTAKSYALDALVMSVVSVIVYGFMQLIMPPVPYTDNKVVGVAKIDHGVIISATFLEGQCALRSISVYSAKDGKETPVDWTSLDGTKKNDADRAAGKRHMIIKVFTFNTYPNRITIYTNHDCGSEPVRMQFADVALPK